MHNSTANNPKSSGAEGFQRAIGKPFGCRRSGNSPLQLTKSIHIEEKIPCGTNHRGIIHLLAASAALSGYMRFRSFRMHEK